MVYASKIDPRGSSARGSARCRASSRARAVPGDSFERVSKRCAVAVDRLHLGEDVQLVETRRAPGSPEIRRRPASRSSALEPLGPEPASKVKSGGTSRTRRRAIPSTAERCAPTRAGDQAPTQAAVRTNVRAASCKSPPEGHRLGANKSHAMTTPGTPEAIEALLQEARRFPPPPAFAAQANAKPGIYEEAERDSQACWAGWARKFEWMKPFTTSLEWNEPFARWFADGELNASVNALDRHVRNGLARARRLLLRRRARRPLDGHLRRAARRGVPLRQRPAQPRHQEGRPRRDLHADDRRAAGGDAGLRAHRRGALGDLRRLLAGRDRRPRQRRGVRRADHRRSRLAARQEGPAQRKLRRGDRARACRRSST